MVILANGKVPQGIAKILKLLVVLYTHNCIACSGLASDY